MASRSRLVVGGFVGGVARFRVLSPSRRDAQQVRQASLLADANRMRELALAVIDIGIVAGLLWSLWFVFAHGRRERKRIAEHLAAPLVKTDDRVVVRPDLKGSLFFTVLFGWLAFAAVGKAVESKPGGGGVVLVAAALGLGWLAALYGKRAVLRRPVLALDGHGMTVGSSSHTIAWHDVHDVRLVEYRTVVGASRHRLVCDVSRADGTGIVTLAIELETLSLPWDEIVVALQNHTGRRVAV